LPAALTWSAPPARPTTSAGDPERVVTIADYRGAQETGARFSGGPGTERALYALREIGELIEAGRFSLPVAQTFPLGRIGEAHELSQAEHVRGKLRASRRLTRSKSAAQAFRTRANVRLGSYDFPP
jgi:Zinc-binding dehydrogenase